MEHLSIWHWAIIILILIVYLVPAARILQKAGYSGCLCILMLVPPLNLIFYWVFAFVKWPVEQRASLMRWVAHGCSSSATFGRTISFKDRLSSIFLVGWSGAAVGHKRSFTICRTMSDEEPRAAIFQRDCEPAIRR